MASARSSLRKQLFHGYLHNRGPQDEDELYAFIYHILGMKVPRDVFTPGHTSPFQMIKELYFEEVTRAVVMANRGGMKTMGVSILNYLDMQFKGIEVGLIAATRDQADKGYKYLTSFFKVPEINPMVKTSIKSHSELYTGGSVQIHTGTIKGMNSGHPCKVSIDEVELIDYPVLEEGMSMSQSMIGLDKRVFPGRDLFISTRKKSTGTMQKLINQTESDTSITKLYQWNIFDVIERCERKCFADPKHGDCPAWERCQGAAHNVPDGGFFKIQDFINKASTITDFNWSMQYLCQKVSEQRVVFNDTYVNAATCINSRDFLNKYNAEDLTDIDWHRFKHYGGIDFGVNFVYMHFLFDASDNTHYMIWEYHCNVDRVLSQHALKINNPPYVPEEKIRTCWKYYDPSGRQEALELGSYKVTNLIPAENDIEAGLDAVKEAFRNRRLVVVRDLCPNFMKERELYVYPTDSEGNIISYKPVKEFDHSCDASRYGFYGNKLGLLPKGYGTARTGRVNIR